LGSSRDDLRRRAALAHELEEIKAAGEPFVRQRTALRSLVDDWAAMSADHRKRLLGTMFEEVIVGSGEVSELVPREGWKRYLKAALIERGWL
jgi:hypothetical protein